MIRDSSRLDDLACLLAWLIARSESGFQPGYHCERLAVQAMAAAEFGDEFTG
jgi:hypothetical protein